MRKLSIIMIISILFVLLIESNVYPVEEGNYEEFTIHTNNGVIKTLLIPKDIELLKQAFIDIATLYLEEKKDHEISLAEIDDLLKIITEYKENEETYKEIISLKDIIINNYKKKNPFWVSGIVAGIDTNFQQYYSFCIGYEALMAHKIIINLHTFLSLYLMYPSSIELGLGIDFSYLF